MHPTMTIDLDAMKVVDMVRVQACDQDTPSTTSMEGECPLRLIQIVK